MRALITFLSGVAVGCIPVVAKMDSGQDTDPMNVTGDEGGSDDSGTGEDCACEDLEARLAAMEETNDALVARVTSLEEGLSAVSDQVGEVEDRVSDIEEGGTSSTGAGNEVWSYSDDGYVGEGTEVSWESFGAVELTLERTDPILAWCRMDSVPYTSLRISLTSEDGGWSDEGTASILEAAGVDFDYHWPAFAMAVFEPPATGSYTLSCESYYSDEAARLDLIAFQAAPSL